MNTETQKIEPLLLTPKETAKILNICERTLFALTQRGELPSIRIGRAVRFPMAELQKWIEKKSFENSQKGS